MPEHLYEIADDIRWITRHLEDGELYEEGAAEALDHLNLALGDKLDRCALYVRELEAQTDTLDKEIDRLTGRKLSIQRQRDWMRSYMARNMEKAGVQKHKSALVTVSLRKGSDRVVVDNEQALDPQYIRTITGPNKSLIKQALLEGEVEGAHLEKGADTVSIR